MGRRAIVKVDTGFPHLDYIMGPARVLRQDPCPSFGLPDVLTVAHISEC